MYVALTREVKEAWAAYDNAAEPEQRARRKERWQQLAIMQILLLQWRQALQNKLAAPGVCLLCFVLVNLSLLALVKGKVAAPS